MNVCELKRRIQTPLTLGAGYLVGNKTSLLRLDLNVSGWIGMTAVTQYRKPRRVALTTGGDDPNCNSVIFSLT